ncbi:predicted protein [Arabidopsis lyrata subsp. lyrata]|uniref:Predicted protein n=1 Tax=Arabidopsis lyrata subsp. lyrata TaxID=81972 RepID=D7MVN6_ARALL|nr:predicted protein [Arabidopsis lyrata subsp. lyrata]
MEQMELKFLALSLRESYKDGAVDPIQDYFELAGTCTWRFIILCCLLEYGHMEFRSTLRTSLALNLTWRKRIAFKLRKDKVSHHSRKHFNLFDRLINVMEWKPPQTKPYVSEPLEVLILVTYFSFSGDFAKQNFGNLTATLHEESALLRKVGSTLSGHHVIIFLLSVNAWHKNEEEKKKKDRCAIKRPSWQVEEIELQILALSLTKCFKDRAMAEEERDGKDKDEEPKKPCFIILSILQNARMSLSRKASRDQQFNSYRPNFIQIKWKVEN